MNIHLVSAPNREDIIEGYRLANKAFWPQCPFQIKAIDGPCDNFTERLINYLECLDEEFIFLTLDDYYPYKRILHSMIINGIEYIKNHNDIGRIIFVMVKVPEKDTDLKGFGEFDNAEPLYKRTIFLPSVYRKSYLLNMAKAVRTNMRPAQMQNWPGAYNFELYTGPVSTNMRVLSSKYQLLPHRIINAVEQGKWHPLGIRLLTSINAGIDFTKRGIHTPDDNPYMDAWQRAR